MQAINAKFLGYGVSFFLALFTIIAISSPEIAHDYGIARFILVPFAAQACNLIIKVTEALSAGFQPAK